MSKGTLKPLSPVFFFFFFVLLFFFFFFFSDLDSLSKLTSEFKIEVVGFVLKK